MAFSTLNALRALLNTDLGRTDASTTPWGTDTDCNTFLQQAIRRMWPRMARLIKETVTPVTSTMDYSLTSIRDVVQIDELDTDGLFKGQIRSWRVYVDESDASDAPVYRLLLPEVDTSLSLRVTGYAPYVIPATGGDTVDLPSTLLHVAVAGGRAEAFRRRRHEYVDYANRQMSNPVTSVQPNELERAYEAAEDAFESLLRLNARNFTASRRATLKVQ